MFHLSISQAPLNPHFVTAMQAFEEHIAVCMCLHGRSLRRTSDGLHHVLVEHTAIYEAISTGDTSAARTLMRTHLQGSRDRLFAPTSAA